MKNFENYMYTFSLATLFHYYAWDILSWHFPVDKSHFRKIMIESSREPYAVGKDIK